MQPLIVVPANDIDAAGMDLSVELPRAWIDDQLSDAGARAKTPGSFKGRLSRSGKADVVVRGKVAADVTVPCARCLAPADVPIETELALLLKPKAAAPPAESGKAKARAAAAGKARSNATRGARGAEYEFAAAEADLDEYDGEKVVLDEFVREAMLLELPSFPLCKEDCDGGSRADEGLPLPRAGGSSPGSMASGSTQPRNPFEVLRGWTPGSPLPSEESLGNARPPSQADIRRIARAKSRAKPKIRSSALQRGKK